MNWFEALVLAVVQGLTEFLPVSSDGHLVLAGALLGELPAGFLQYELLLHLGTLLATLVFFRRDLVGLGRAFLPGAADPAAPGRRRIVLLLLAALLPTFVLVKAFDSFLEGLHAVPASAVAGLAVNGAMLLAASRWAPAGTLAVADTPWWKAALVGVAQAASPVPGISRSGTTIVAALFCGMRREDAVRFSFLLSIPTVGGAVALKLAAGPGPAAIADPAALAAGVALAALTGYAAILLVLRWTREGRLWQFGLYCLAAAALAAAALAAR